MWYINMALWLGTIFGFFGWALLTFVLWNVSTIWWIWLATPVGPFAATIASSFLNMVAFMLFHTVSKKGPKALAYTLLVSGWIATEYWYTTGDFSWPWLLLGNGFSHEVWAVQWYEYTGIFGGTLWVLLSNILLYEAWRRRRDAKAWTWAGAVPFRFSFRWAFSGVTKHLTKARSRYP